MCAFAVADTITSVSPRTINVGAVEDFLTITGDGLQGGVSTVVVFSGPAGTFAQEPSSVRSTEIITWIPVEVIVTPGTYNVTVQATDTTGVRTIGPGQFEVLAAPAQQPPLLNVPEAITALATSSAGAQVFFAVTGFSYVDAAPTIACTQQSGAIFPLGTTRVSCTAFDSAGSTTADFFIIVLDGHAPVLHLPANITTSNPVVTYNVTAEDDLGGPVVISCSPLSGSTFPNGTTTVNCAAFDENGNDARGSFKVTITGGAPALTLPAPMTVEATGPTGAAVNFIATSDSGPVSCNPPSGSVFPLGLTTVTCSATNNVGTASGTFNVTVVDTKPPVLSLPANITAAAGVVTYNAFGTDLVDGVVPAICTPPSGSTFAIGVTLVSCS
ncbi:MAG TPA: HYR domain-containing protein, partial [Thermoanaerobaculia bacterium]